MFFAGNAVPTATTRPVVVSGPNQKLTASLFRIRERQVHFTYIDVEALQWKYFNGKFVLWRVAEELASTFVPFYRVQKITFQVKITHKNGRFTFPNGLWDGNSYVFQTLNKPCERERDINIKLIYFFFYSDSGPSLPSKGILNIFCANKYFAIRNNVMRQQKICCEPHNCISYKCSGQTMHRYDSVSRQNIKVKMIIIYYHCIILYSDT